MFKLEEEGPEASLVRALEAKQEDSRKEEKAFRYQETEAKGELSENGCYKDCNFR